MVAFNFNMPVIVSLKDMGKQILQQHDLMSRISRCADENGNIEMPLFEVMQIFGPHMPGYGPISKVDETPIKGDILVSNENFTRYASVMTDEEYTNITEKLDENKTK